MRTLTLWILAIAAAAAQEAPAGPLPSSIPLARSWEQAIREATIRNVPIIFTTALAT